MIPSARTRLALTYLAIIMALTLGFSAVFYNQSINEAKGNLQNQELQLRDFLYFTTPEGVANIRERQLGVFRRSLLKRLAVLNSGMLVLGGYVSYTLARRSLRPLEETLEAQSRFTSDAAHELRTPLTAMKTEIEVAMRDKGLKLAEAKDTLSSNLEEIIKLETLTAALLRLARSSNMEEKSHWQTYKVTDILDAALARVKDKVAGKKITFQIPKSKNTVYGDSDQLVELFVTLFDNAVKYSPANSTVQVTTSRSDGKTLIDVTDKGIGITEVDMPHIFERFYRADQSRNKSKIDGYGLGLSLAESIARAHNGSITVKSVYQEGSTFGVELPSQQ